MFAAAPGARAVFIWDDALFRQMDYGFKKCVFIYEALTALPVDIIAGPTVEVLRGLAAGGVIHTAETANPHLAAIWLIWPIMKCRKSQMKLLSGSTRRLI